MGRFRTGDEFEGVVCDFGMSGEGIVKDGAYPIFVPFAIVGERVRLRIVHAKKDYAFGELIEVLTPSNERVKPRCRHFGRCGGCDLQHLSHAMQEEVKRVSVERTMKKAGVDVAVPEVIAGNPWAYRNKLALPFGRMGRHGKIVLGFFEKKSHRVVPLKECPLHGAWASDVVAAVTDWANECGLSVYDEGTGKGLLRHVVARFVTTPSCGQAGKQARRPLQGARALRLSQQGKDQRHHGRERPPREGQGSAAEARRILRRRLAREFFASQRRDEGTPLRRRLRRS